MKDIVAIVNINNTDWKLESCSAKLYTKNHVGYVKQITSLMIVLCFVQD